MKYDCVAFFQELLTPAHPAPSQVHVTLQQTKTR